MDLYQKFGGAAKCRELSTAFYTRVSKDPTLRPFFPGKSMKCPIEEFAAFLAQFLGGPSEDARRRWWLSLQQSHQRFQIGKTQRDAWLVLMNLALSEVELPESMRKSLRDLFDEASAYLMNSPVVAAEIQMADSALQVRWQQQRDLDGAVAAIANGDLPGVIAIVESGPLQTLFKSNHSVFANLIGVLVGGGHPKLADYGHRLLLENPEVAHQRYSDRTLLHAASAAGDLPFVADLLRMGADTNVQDGGGHTPLYSVGNLCPGGGPVIRALVEAGAKVDACEGIKRCTALHMAARCGNTEAAGALLDCGANIEARDSNGETPLRRAVNCRQASVVELLLARGSDPQAADRKGATPQSAARTDRMRALFKTVTT